MSLLIDRFLDRFEVNRNVDAMVWRNAPHSYGALLDATREMRNEIAERAIPKGATIAVEADFTPRSVALVLALLDRGCIALPLTAGASVQKASLFEIAEAEFIARALPDDTVTFSQTNRSASHPLFAELRRRDRAGLVFFSSGSSGSPKGAVHDAEALLEKFAVARRGARAISFLRYDHVGGMNQLFQSLSNGGTLVTVEERSPDSVLRAIQDHRVELLPISPSFLNLVLLSEAYRRFDLSSLTTVSYGTEPMPETTLRRFHELFPHVRLLQMYGLSEVGILHSKSRSSDSLWIQLGGDGFETRVVDDMLQIKARSAMLGYLNAPSPFTEDGFFMTGDLVERDGDWLRILGRKSDLINVGGQKVYPAEVESVIHEIDNVRDVTVRGEANAIMGQIVTARVTLSAPEPLAQFTLRLKKYCASKLSSYKVPVRVTLVDGDQHGDRFKRFR